MVLFMAIAAAFARLCVETIIEISLIDTHHAAAFARLCVETDEKIKAMIKDAGSRLRAAVC